MENCTATVQPAPAPVYIFYGNRIIKCIRHIIMINALLQTGTSKIRLGKYMSHSIMINDQ